MNGHSCPPGSSARGFSLPEIALSLAILSVAFVSLFALLPIGLGTFRESIDTSNETWIMQSLNSMIQTTEWKKIWGENGTIAQDVYFFDEEGRPTDTQSNPSNDPKVLLSRVYEVKLFAEPLYRPALSSATDAFTANDKGNGTSDPMAARIIAVLGNVNNRKATTLFDHLEEAEQLNNLPPNSGLKVKTLVAAQMNSL